MAGLEDAVIALEKRISILERECDTWRELANQGIHIESGLRKAMLLKDKEIEELKRERDASHASLQRVLTLRCVLSDLGECIARVPEACKCQQMSKEIYMEAVKRLIEGKP